MTANNDSCLCASQDSCHLTKPNGAKTLGTMTDDTSDTRRVTRARFLEAVDALREELDMTTDAAVAKHLGIDPTQISNTRRDESRGVGAHVLQKVARAAGVSMDFFFDESSLRFGDFARFSRVDEEAFAPFLDDITRWLGTAPTRAELRWLRLAPRFHRMDARGMALALDGHRKGMSPEQVAEMESATSKWAKHD